MNRQEGTEMLEEYKSRSRDVGLQDRVSTDVFEEYRGKWARFFIFECGKTLIGSKEFWLDSEEAVLKEMQEDRQKVAALNANGKIDTFLHMDSGLNCICPFNSKEIINRNKQTGLLKGYLIGVHCFPIPVKG